MTTIIKDRPSNVIFEMLNYISNAKDTGVLKGYEFSQIIELIGDITANKIKRGLMSEEEVEQMEALLPTNEIYFSHYHSDLPRACKMFLEGNDIALEQASRRNLFAQSKKLR